MMGVRAIYHDGWVAATTPIRPPWVLTGPAVTNPETAYKWELYNISKDWSENNDLAASNPAKLKELQGVLNTEMQKYQVFPLDASVATRLVAPRPNLTAGRTEFTYTAPLTGIPYSAAPSLLNTSYTIKADVEVPAGGGDGMIATEGGRFGGYGFYILKGKPTFTWNLLDLKRVKWQGTDALTPGKHTLEFDFNYDGLGFATLAFNNMSGLGRPGTGVLKVDGKTVSTETMPKTIPLILQWDETFDIGSDTGTGVDDQDYQSPFPFNGKVVKLIYHVEPPKLTPADIQKLKEGAMAAADAK
jgi:arylsulfatase